MNHFISLLPDDATRERLAAVAERMQAWDLPARWVHPEDYHLTLNFLGHLDEDEARMLPHAIDDVAAHPVLEPLRLAGLGAFAGRSAPRVVYAALDDPQERCRHLADDLAAALGDDPDRRFHPHITLCRPQPGGGGGGRGWPELLAGYGLADWGWCRPVAVALQAAEPGPHHLPRYRTLASWPW